MRGTKIMEFEYKGSIFVEERDLVEMVRLVKEESYKIVDAISEVASSWDDAEYYLLSEIVDGIEKEIEKRIKES